MKSDIIFGIVDIGAGGIRCQISEVSKNSDAGWRIKTLEYIIFPLSIGMDTFLKKYITFDTVYRAAEIFSKIKLKFKEYSITGNYRAVCTSAVRDAENKHFFINHIRVRTGIELEIIDENDELYIKYLGVSETLNGFKKLESKGAVLVNLSSGNVGINIRKNKIPLFSSTLPYGALRIFQLFSDIEERVKYRAYEQYINKLVLLLKKSCAEYDKITSVIGSDTSTGLLSEIFKPEGHFFDISDLTGLYLKIKTIPIPEICVELSINDYDAKILKPVLYVYISIMKSVGAKKLYFSDQNFSDQLTRFYLIKTKEKKFNKKLIEYFFYFGKKFNLDDKHAKQVLMFSEKIRRSLKNILIIKPDERAALIGSAVLHDIGYYTNINDHHEYSYRIINSLNIPGLNREILENIAFCAFFHGSSEYLSSDTTHYRISSERELTIKKVISILKIADALDASHMQLIKDIRLEVSDKAVNITAVSSVTPFLEIKFFKLKSTDFLETFGIPVELAVKLDYE
jgi:exopolyphosphatase/guanosine-5'-triphosphate,3'-diphosphate pyrophosphatase